MQNGFMTETAAAVLNTAALVFAAWLIPIFPFKRCHKKRLLGLLLNSCLITLFFLEQKSDGKSKKSNVSLR